MQTLKNDNKAMSLTVTDGLSVTIVPNSEHEFLMTTKEVANGYGVSPNTVRTHAFAHRDEIIEGTHFIKGVGFPNTLSNTQPHQVFWTKVGVIRLGFFIKSERAKIFRDWAESLILTVIGHKQSVLLPTITTKRKINRLTPARVINILALVNEIDNHDLRMKLSNEIMGGHNYGN